MLNDQLPRQSLGGRIDRMRFLRQLVGPSQEEVWLRLACETGTSFVAGRFWRGSKIAVWVKAEADQLVSVEPSSDIRQRAMDKDGKSRHYPALLTLAGSYLEVSGLHLVGVRDRLPHNLYSENGVSISGGVGCRLERHPQALLPGRLQFQERSPDRPAPDGSLVDPSACRRLAPRRLL